MHIGLRHDIDTIIGGLKGVPRIIDMEDKHDARSSFYVRVKLLKNRQLLRLLRYAEANGWEIGLHLDNTLNKNEAVKELEIIKNYGFHIQGVTPHGGEMGFNPRLTWRVMDELGKKGIIYAQTGYFPPNEKLENIKVLPPHITLDWYIRRNGARGYLYFKRDIEYLISNNRYPIVSTHPEFFIFSVGIIGTMQPRIKGVKVRLYKEMSKSIMMFLSVLKKRLVKEYYMKFLEEYYRKTKLVPLVEIAKII